MRAAVLILTAVLGGCSSIQLGDPLGRLDLEAPVAPIQQVWERDVQGAFGPSAPTVTQRYVVVGTRRGEVVVLDRETGVSKGVGEFGDSVEGAVAVSEDGGVIYVPTAERDGGVEAYDVARGRRVWRWKGGAIEGGVARVGSVLIVPLLQSKIIALEAATGRELWSRDPVVGVQIHAAPVVASSRSGRTLDASAVIADDRGHVQRLEVATGRPLWTVEIGEPVHATPALENGLLIVTTTRGSVLALEAETGAERWRVASETVLRASPPALMDGLAVVGFTDGTVRALALEDGAERWRYRTDGNVTATPLPLGDQVAVGTMDRRLLLLDAETGRETWSARLRGRVKSALGVGGGLLVALVEPRHVVAFQSVP